MSFRRKTGAMVTMNALAVAVILAKCMARHRKNWCILLGGHTAAEIRADSVRSCLNSHIGNCFEPSLYARLQKMGETDE
jgi:hypothetical protein